MTGKLKENLEAIRSQIKSEIARCKTPRPPQILAVSKKQSVQKIRELFQLGVHQFGENYLQEALEKKQSLCDLPIEWHFIGQIQSKKIPYIVGEFDLIQTLSRTSEAEKISQVAERKNCEQKVLIQVNIAGEESKQGVEPDNLAELVRRVQSLPHLQLKGLMFFPPLSEDPEETEQWFSKCGSLFRSFQSQDPSSFQIFSLGTSQDYLAALRHGSTMVRLGESLMGPRS